VILALLLLDTLRLGPGVHPGPLVLMHPTVVIGVPGRTVIRGDGHGSVVVVRAPHCELRDLRIEGSGRSPEGPDAGVFVQADSVRLENLVIRDVLFGVYLYEANGAVLRRLDIAGPTGLAEGQMGDGIYLYHARGVTAIANTITSVRDGIYFEYSDSARITDNRVTRVRFGLHYMFSHANRFERNTFTHNAAGAVIMNSRGVTVSDNVFAWNSGSRSYGLVLQTATDPVVRGNAFTGNGIGVFFDNVIGGDFEDNLVQANWLGLELFANSERTRVTGNRVIGNTFDATGGAAPGSFTLCVAGRGNYWSAAIAGGGYDLDGDGVLDRSHSAGSPLAELAFTRAGLRLFLDTPAARALTWAERSLPVFDVATATDSCPLTRPPQGGVDSLVLATAAPDAHGRTMLLVLAAAMVGSGMVAVSRRPRAGRAA
jgi:nitrous oxidase accessory protein